MQGKVIEFEVLNCTPHEKNMLWQYDYGKKMRLLYPGLPSMYEVHFSNSIAGASYLSVGDSTGVEIPAQVTSTGKNIYFWLFIHETLTSGETIYGNCIRVKQRGKLPTSEPTPEQRDIIEELLAALTAGVEEVENAVEHIQETVDTALSTAKQSGEFDGTTFTPAINDAGDLSWTNDGGKPNPQTVNIKGPKGDDGEVTRAELESGLSGKADKTDTVFTSTLSRGRKSDTNVGTGSIAYGDNVTATGNYSTAKGKETVATGENSSAEGGYGTASGLDSHVEGAFSYATGDYSHSEGYYNVSNALAAHTEGYNNTASASYTHAEGRGNTATGAQAHAEGYGTQAASTNAHAEGRNAVASGDTSHAEGRNTTASGAYAHAENYYATASGNASHAEGYRTIAGGAFQHVFGQYNKPDYASDVPDWVPNTSYVVGDLVKRNGIEYVCKTANSDSTFNPNKWTEDTFGLAKFVEIVGGGTSSSTKNIRTLDWKGNQRIYGTLYVNCNASGTGGSQVATQGMLPTFASNSETQAIISEYGVVSA